MYSLDNWGVHAQESWWSPPPLPGLPSPRWHPTICKCGCQHRAVSRVWLPSRDPPCTPASPGPWGQAPGGRGHIQLWGQKKSPSGSSVNIWLILNYWAKFWLRQELKVSQCLYGTIFYESLSFSLMYLSCLSHLTVSTDGVKNTSSCFTTSIVRKPYDNKIWCAQNLDSL